MSRAISDETTSGAERPRARDYLSAAMAAADAAGEEGLAPGETREARFRRLKTQLSAALISFHRGMATAWLEEDDFMLDTLRAWEVRVAARHHNLAAVPAVTRAAVGPTGGIATGAGP